MTSVITSLDVSSVVDRALAWALARPKPDEEGNKSVPNKGTELVFVRRKKVDEGGSVPSRLDNVLNLPLKKRDHSSHVIGVVGSGVAIKEPFGTAKPKGIREASVEIERRVRKKLREELKEELREELRAEMTSRMNVLFREKFLTLAKQAGLPNQMEVETNSMIAPYVPSSYKSKVANSLATREEIRKEQSPKRNDEEIQKEQSPERNDEEIRKVQSPERNDEEKRKEQSRKRKNEEIRKEQSRKRKNEKIRKEQSPKRNDEEIRKEQSPKRNDEEIPKEQSPKRNEVVSGAKCKKFGNGHNRKGFLTAARLIPTMR